jgi:hypothetical protein
MISTDAAILSVLMRQCGTAGISNKEKTDRNQRGEGFKKPHHVVEYPEWNKEHCLASNERDFVSDEGVTKSITRLKEMFNHQYHNQSEPSGLMSSAR